MPNTYKNAGYILTGTANTTIYTSPAAGGSLVNSIYIAPSGASATADIKWNDTSAGAEYPIILGVSIPTGAAFQPIDGAIVLESGDSVNIQLSTGSAIISVFALEVS